MCSALRYSIDELAYFDTEFRCSTRSSGSRRAEKPSAPAKAGGSAFRLFPKPSILPSCRIIVAIGSRRDILLHCEPARPPVGFAGDTNRRVAGGGSGGPRPRAVPH
jgi:hypothetical protein